MHESDKNVYLMIKGSTFFIKAVNIIRVFRGNVGINEETCHVFCTVFMGILSEDGNALVVNPTVPEGMT